MPVTPARELDPDGAIAAYDQRLRSKAAEQVGGRELDRMCEAYRRMTLTEQARFAHVTVRQANMLGIFRRRGVQGCDRPRGAGRPATRRRTVRSSARSGDSGSDGPAPPRTPAFVRYGGGFR